MSTLMSSSFFSFRLSHHRYTTTVGSLSLSLTRSFHHRLINEKKKKRAKKRIVRIATTSFQNDFFRFPLKRSSLKKFFFFKLNKEVLQRFPSVIVIAALETSTPQKTPILPDLMIHSFTAAISTSPPSPNPWVVYQFRLGWLLYLAERKERAKGRTYYMVGIIGCCVRVWLRQRNGRSVFTYQTQSAYIE